MARYADTLLVDGERVVVRTRQHWLATVVDGRRQWTLLAGSLVLLVLSLTLDGVIRDVVGWVVLAGIVLSVGVLIVHYWAWYAQDYLVTSRRVLKVEGIINKRSADSSLEKINDAVLEQNLFGRILDYGDLNILTAADVDLDEYKMLNHAPHFKRQMLNQKHELEMEGTRLPSPPLRAPAAAGMTPVGGGPANPMSPPGAMAPGYAAPANAPTGAPMSGTAAPMSGNAAQGAPGAQGAMSAAQILDAVDGLAKLRDSGALTPAEFETKKAELLRRL